MDSIGSTTLAKAPKIPTALDQRRLYAIGLDQLRALSGSEWTDHNVHDPGIMMLELLSFVLTDLAYRASLPMEALVDPGRLPTARTILPNEPLTTTDYRKLILDVPGVKNAWVVPSSETVFGNAASGEVSTAPPANMQHVRRLAVRGLYKVLLDYDEAVQSEAARQEIKDRVSVLLHEHRNLGEDFLSIEDVPREAFIVCGEIDLAPDADVDAVHSALLHGVHEYLAPGVNRYSLAAMQARTTASGTPYSAPEIFEGPRLERGFYDDRELAKADLLRQIRLSDVQHVVMGIGGVVAIRDMLVSPKEKKGRLANRWVLDVRAGHSPSLDFAASRIVYYKRGLPIVAKAPAPPTTGSGGGQPFEAKAEDLPLPRRDRRDVTAYSSVQHHLPAVYGLGEHGLPATVDTARLAQARQLKAYLMFFDQIMANYCVQLAGIDRLFSIDAGERDTYYTQPVGAVLADGIVATTLPDAARIYDGADADPGEPLNERFVAIAKALDAALTAVVAGNDRRERFLDHLISRYAERFHDYVGIMQSAFGATDEALIADRRRFLNDYPEWGGRRGQADNRTLAAPEELWNQNRNIAGLEWRLARLLGMPNDRRRSLATTELAGDISIAADGTGQFGFTLHDLDVPPIESAPVVLLRQVNRLPTEDQARALLLKALDLGQVDASYLKKTVNGVASFSIVDKTGEVVAESDGVADEAARDRLLAQTRTYLRAHYSREGLFIIEDVLLRPVADGDAALHFCADPGCEECAADDPYSHRVHVVMPAFAGRFTNMDFRRFAETVIREEMPAHLLPRICWASEEAMKPLEEAYRDWLEVRAGLHADERQARLKTFVTRLQDVRSVYPVQPLVRCKDGAGKPKFLLGRAALGRKANP